MVYCVRLSKILLYTSFLCYQIDYYSINDCNTHYWSSKCCKYLTRYRRSSLATLEVFSSYFSLTTVDFNVFLMGMSKHSHRFQRLDAFPMRDTFNYTSCKGGKSLKRIPELSRHCSEIYYNCIKKYIYYMYYEIIY